MAPDQNTLKRLAFIKYLYKLGLEQSEKHEPLCYAALLTFHDTTELFLHLASEYLNAPQKSNQKFMEYWDIISTKMQKGNGLTQKASMERLNKARTELKHYGILPHKSELDSFKTVTKIFLEDNTKLIFCIDFSEISLIDLIHCVDAKNDLIAAEQLLMNVGIEDSLDKIAFSFAKLFKDYKNSVKERFGHYPYSFSSPTVNITTISDESSEFGVEVSDFSSDVESSLDDMGTSISELQDTVEIISLGIDYRRYVKFNLLIPRIKKVSTWLDPVKSKEKEWEYQIVRTKRGSRGTPTPEDVQFCIDFVIESAIILQEFDL